jgi:hypothetical protein
MSPDMQRSINSDIGYQEFSLRLWQTPHQRQSSTVQTPGVEAIVFNWVKNLIILLLDSKQERKVTHEKLKD